MDRRFSTAFAWVVIVVLFGIPWTIGIGVLFARVMGWL